MKKKKKTLTITNGDVRASDDHGRTHCVGNSQIVEIDKRNYPVGTY